MSTVEPVNLRGRYAGFVTRLFAYVLDAVIVAGALLVATAVVGEALRFAFEIELGPDAAVASLVAFLATAAYYVGFWSGAGRTPGKAVLGLRVVSRDGGRIGVGQATVRYFGYFLSAALFFLGFLWVLVDDKRAAWHDHLARTAVIYDWDAREVGPRRR